MSCIATQHTSALFPFAHIATLYHCRGRRRHIYTIICMDAVIAGFTTSLAAACNRPRFVEIVCSP
jgi:hypothetical protein